uniref:Methyltransf_11 domain-containing protein n=1 Tax=Anisakis simplex TaxID=6269 RepID=A0A0M3JLP8_ANISI
LGLMACSDIVEVDETGEKFWIKKERIPLMTGDTMSKMFVYLQHLPMVGKVYSQLSEVMRIDGPLGLDNDVFDDFHLRMSAFSEVRHKKFLINDYLPLTGMKEKLENEVCQVLDVGCGRGMHAAEFGDSLQIFLFALHTF